MSGPDATPSVFAANPAIRQEYGQVLDYLAPRLSAYNTVFIMSEREYQTLHERSGGGRNAPETLLGILKELFPDRDIDGIFKTEADRKLLGQAIEYAKADVKFDGKDYDVDPHASTLRVGTNEAPVRIGFISLPEVSVTTPEMLAGSVKGRERSSEEQEQRRQDTKAFVVDHEVQHLVDEAQQNIARTDFDPAREMNNASQRAEVFADRGAKADIPDMVARGLIKDPAIIHDIEDARKIETFHDLVQRGEKWTVGKDGNQPGKIVQDKNIDDHATGFSLDPAVPLEEQGPRLERTAKEIADIRNATLGNMYEQAQEGKSTPAASQVYGQVLMRMQSDPTFGERFTRKPVDPEEGQRLSFNKMLTRKPEVVREMAEGWQKTPALSQEARGMAADYVAAYDHFVGGNATAHEAKVKEPDAAAPVAVPPTASTVQPVQAPGR